MATQLACPETNKGIRFRPARIGLRSVAHVKSSKCSCPDYVCLYDQVCWSSNDILTTSQLATVVGPVIQSLYNLVANILQWSSCIKLPYFGRHSSAVTGMIPSEIWDRKFIAGVPTGDPAADGAVASVSVLPKRAPVLCQLIPETYLV